MPGFSSDEVQAAVDRFLMKTVAVSRLPVTGVRDTLAARDQIYDLLTTALLLRTDSYFYLIWLAKNRLRKLVDAQISALDDIDAWASGVSRPSKRITSTAELVNAQAAALSLNAGLNARTAGIRGAIGPSVDRFRGSIERFVTTELTKNVMVAGVVTETAEELQQRIRATWAEAVERAAEIDRRAQNIDEALSSFGDVRLPESAIRDIVGRIHTRLVELQDVLTGSSGLGDSREAMLDLLTMRTLMARVSSFRNPVRELFRGTGALIDSAGVQASIEGTVSAPYNYDPGDTLTLSVSAAPVVVTLPRTSRAQVYSQPLSFPSGPGAAADLAVALDFAGTTSVTPSASYTDGPAAAAGLTTLLSGAAEVTWEASTSRLLFESLTISDDSYIAFLNDSAARLQVTDWLFGGPTISGRSDPPTIEEVIEAINLASPDLAATSTTTTYAGFTGTRSAVGGEEALIWDLWSLHTNLIADGSNVVRSPTQNFEALGVKVGYGIVILAPGPSAGEFSITAVDGSRLTLSGDVAATVSGAYYLGPDYSSIPAGARVRVAGGESANTGFYRVVVGEIARIEVTPPLQVTDEALRVSVFQQLLRIEALGTTTTAGIGVITGSAGATALGLAVTAAEAAAQLGTLELSGDPLAAGVRAGDQVLLTSPSSLSYTRVAQEITTSRVAVEAVATELGTWDVVINAARHLAFDDLQFATAAYLASAYAGDSISILDGVMGRLIRGARYASILSTPINDYSTALTTLRTALDAYVVSREFAIDNTVQTMREQGFDRALDLLLSLEIEEFFTMSVDSISYSTHFTRKAATAAREITPISKFAKSERVIQEFSPVSSQPNPYDPE